MREVLKRIRDEGPLMARDFEDTRQTKNAWWDWKPAKHALDQLFMQGDLVAAGRAGFQKIYDLPERVIPDTVDTSMPSLEEYARHLVDISLNAHGFATAKSFTYLRKGKALRGAVQQVLAERLDSRELIAITLADNTTAYAQPEILDTRSPRCSDEVRILSPFDNTVIQRERGRDIFDFDYQIECYVPAPKRQYGYFCLPLLYRDAFVGRIDCKAHRKKQKLEVKTMHLEGGVDTGFSDALGSALSKFAVFNQCEPVSQKETDELIRNARLTPA